jgi:hypothetical protein
MISMFGFVTTLVIMIIFNHTWRSFLSKDKIFLVKDRANSPPHNAYISGSSIIQHMNEQQKLQP